MTMWPFGETVLLWRLHRGLTQAQLAELSGISRPNISAIERGDRDVTLSTLRTLAFALGVKPGVLVDGRSPYGEPLALSRSELEKVAHAVANAENEPSYELLIRCLRSVGAARRMAKGEGKRTRESRIATGHAYLVLKAMVTSQTINSLLSRIDGYVGAA